MSDVTIHINVCTDNAAFDDAPDIELARIGQDAVQYVNTKEGISRRLFDINGNRIGEIKSFVDVDKYDDWYRDTTANITNIICNIIL